MSPAITIHTRHRRIGPELRAHIEQRLERIVRVDPSISAIDVEISSERDGTNGNAGRQRVDLTARSHGRVLRVEESARDAWHAVDRASKRLQEQARRERQRRLGRRFLGRRLMGRARGSS